MKKIFLLVLITLIFTVNGVTATGLVIPNLDIPDLGDIGNIVDNSIIPDTSIDNITDTQLDDPIDTSIPETSNTEDTSIPTSSFPNNFLILGGIIVISAGGLYLYLAKKNRY